MEHRILVAGFGGQGVLLIGSILCHAGLDEGLNVSWLPSYGPEMRGGTASCSVTLSSEEIGSPVVTEPDICIVMNQPSYDRYMTAVRPKGKLFVNVSMVKMQKTRDDIRVFEIPASDISKEVGNSKTANLAMLGAVLAQTGIVKKTSALHALARLFGERREHLLSVNERAMEMGEKRVKKLNEDEKRMA